MNSDVTYWSVAPFAMLLTSIAIGPVVLHRFWERLCVPISLGLGAITAYEYGIGRGQAALVWHAATEWMSFIALVGSLYVIAGGIVVRVKGEATPWVNVCFLLIGSVLASVIGTTGASMVLIRPWIRMNRYRFTHFHSVFFIFLVSNIGGGLTPIGDPPLFIGFLKGVPFWWFLQHLWKPWVLVMSMLLAVFYVVDRANFLRAPAKVREELTAEEKWKVEGGRNVPLLLLAVAAVFLPFGWREAVLVGCAGISWGLTPKRLHETNEFHWGPVREVAVLFVGIFITVLPVMEMLGRRSTEVGELSPMTFYWLTGVCSGFLDNAPTFLAFASAAFGIFGLHLETDMPVFIQQHSSYLEAIALGAVFFGAMSYIGNGPNMMVQHVVRSQKVHCPSFLGYIVWFTLPILIPVLALCAWVTLR